MAYVRQRGATWYVGYRAPTGGWTEKATKAQSKTEARRLGADLERQAERQRLGLRQDQLSVQEHFDCAAASHHQFARAAE